MDLRTAKEITPLKQKNPKKNKRMRPIGCYWMPTSSSKSDRTEWSGKRQLLYSILYCNIKKQDF
jgi:hypothetical protein